MKYLIIIVLGLVIASCEKTNDWENKYPSLVDEKINFSDLDSFWENGTFFIPASDKKTVITMVTASCSPCVEELLGWQKLIDAYSLNDNTNFLFIAQGKTNYYFEKSLKDKYKINLPIYLDSDSTFLKANQLYNISDEHTFIVDENNRIIYVGSPVLSSNNIESFMQILKN